MFNFGAQKAQQALKIMQEQLASKGLSKVRAELQGETIRLSGSIQEKEQASLDAIVAAIKAQGVGVLDYTETGSAPITPPTTTTNTGGGGASGNLSPESISPAKAQTILFSLGYPTGRLDGVFGNQSAQALRQFQSEAKIQADGVLGPQSRQALFQAFFNRPTDLRGQVTQSMLKILGYAVGTVDGVVGPQTLRAIASFEGDYNLPASNGNLSSQTQKVLKEAFIKA